VTEKVAKSIFYFYFFMLFFIFHSFTISHTWLQIPMAFVTFSSIRNF